MPRPEFGRSRPTTAAAAPAALRLVHSQVVGREQMAIAAAVRYGYGLEDAFQGKARHFSFGCSKARPRYHLQRIAPWRTGLPRWADPLRSPRPDDSTIACCPLSPSSPARRSERPADSREEGIGASATSASALRQVRQRARASAWRSRPTRIPRRSQMNGVAGSYKTTPKLPRRSRSCSCAGSVLHPT